MSHLTPLKLSGKFINKTILGRALKRIGLKPQFHERPVQIMDYHRTGKFCAEIVLKRDELGIFSYSDIGFCLNPDSGEYELVADDLCLNKTRARLEPLSKAYMQETQAQAEKTVLAQVAEMEKTKGKATLKWTPAPGGGRRLEVSFAKDNLAVARR